MNFWYSSGSNSTALSPILRAFLSYCWSSIIYTYIRPVYSYSLWYLVSEIKVNLFRIRICWNIRFLYIMDASFSCRILLKLIHFKSRNSGVTLSVLNISHCLPLLQQSWYIFVLHTAVFHCIYPILNYNSLDERR